MTLQEAIDKIYQKYTIVISKDADMSWDSYEVGFRDGSAYELDDVLDILKRVKK